MNLEFINSWFGGNATLAAGAKIIAAIIISYIAYLITCNIVLRIIRKLTQRTKTQYDDLLLSDTVLHRLALIAPTLILYFFAYSFPGVEGVLQRVISAVMILIVMLTIGAFLTAINNAYEKSELANGKPIKGYIQVIKLVMYLLGAIVIIGTLTGQEPWVLLSGVGAMTAIILLIFRDTILSFVASIQIASNDLFRVGDWISMSQHNADGDVVDIALNTIRIQNWDKTISIIPTHKFIEESFKNWRGMQQSGGRRIKRAVNIDISSIRFCTDVMMERFSKFKPIADYIREMQSQIEVYNAEHNVGDNVYINGRRLTNIGTFRIYIEAYLRNNEKVHKGMTFLVRQLEPGQNGLPVEIYVFANDTAWVNYEAIQADIFDHVLSVVPEFDLRVFQNPTGYDFRALSTAQAETEKERQREEAVRKHTAGSSTDTGKEG